MATTAYDYISLANLEDFTGLDYSTIDATKFHDDKVNAMIAIAERIVNGYLGVTAAQTVTDGITSAVTIISAKILNHNLMIMGHLTQDILMEDVVSWNIREILKFFLDSDASIGVDNIPMNSTNE